MLLVWSLRPAQKKYCVVVVFPEWVNLYFNWDLITNSDLRQLQQCLTKSSDLFFCAVCRIILLLQQGFRYICLNGCQCTGPRLGMGTVFAGVGISVMERGWSWDHLISVMRFPTPMGQDLYIEMDPWSLICFIYEWSISLICTILFLTAPQ